MEKASVQRFQEGDTLNTSQVIELINEHRSVIDQFSERYSKHVRNQANLKAKAITAMENGEMGPKLQEAVIAIYGRGSLGQQPIVGSKSIYLELIDVIQSLAQNEAQARNMKTNLIQINMQYNDLMNSLVLLTTSSKETQRRELLKMAANAKDIEEITLSSVLEGKMGAIFNNEAIANPGQKKEKIRDYIDTYDQIFTDALSTFGKKTEIQLPPYLPTAE